MGAYAANTLSKTSIWNENATTVFASDPNSDTKIGRTDVYKDKLGRVVLTRKYVNAAFDEVNTYNVYDTYGNLVMVIPPGAENGGAITTELTFQYIYDNQNRLRGKKVPNAAWQYFYYDNRDLLVLTQDGNMATKPDPDFVLGTKYLGTEYDDIGRVVKTGFVPVSGDPSVYLQSNIVTIPEATYLTKNVYYQDKNWVNFTYNRVLTASGVSAPKATLRTEYDQVRPNLYNYKGFPYWVNQENLFGFDDMNQDFNGAGKPTYSNRYIFIGTESQYSNYAHTWEVHKYDKGLRPKENSHQFYNAITATNLQTIDQLNLFSYDTQDRLTRKDIGKSTAYGNKYLQSTNYAYNARGWLGAINPNFLSTLNDYPIFDCNSDEDVLTTNYPFSYSLPSSNSGEDNPDLFTENVIYDGPDYTIPGAQASQYNGNISQITWQVAGREKQAYSFKYDNLDRLLEANYADIHGNYQYHHWNSQYKYDNKYQEKMSYDVRGNITKMERNGFTGQNCIYPTGYLAGTFGKIDDMTYNYDGTNANKLISITDVVAGTAGKKGFAQNITGTAYAYDANGNLIMDLNKKISNIAYNYLNLPVRITFTKEVTSGGTTTTITTGIIEFMYSASGVKLQKKVILNDLGGAFVSETITNYSNGAEYDGNNNLVRLQHTEGSVVNNSGVYTYEYVLRDHLGNTRVTFGDADNNGIVENSDIKQINSYYPFGLNMEGPGFGVAGANKYQFNGIELNTDFGLNINTAFFRGYDAAVGRWWQVDPKPSFTESIYLGMGNNPVRYSDMLGDSIGLSSSISSNGNLNKAFELFAQSKEGKSFLSQYAKKGQVIGGITFSKDGKYHQKGLNVNYVAKNLGTRNDSDRANTDLDDKSKTITVTINSTFLSKDADSYWKETIGKTLTFFHESFIHVNLFTEDFFDNGKKDYSNIPANIKEAAGQMRSHFQHYKVGYEQTNGNNLWPQQAFEAMKNINKSYTPAIYKNDSDLWKTMWNYEGGTGFEKW